MMAAARGSAYPNYHTVLSNVDLLDVSRAWTNAMGPVRAYGPAPSTAGWRFCTRIRISAYTANRKAAVRVEADRIAVQDSPIGPRPSIFVLSPSGGPP